MNRTVSASLLTVAGAIALVALPAQGQDGGTYSVSDIEGFSELDVSAGMDVEFSVADEYSIHVEVLRGDRDKIRIERDGDTLEVGRQHRNGWNWGSGVRALVTVTAPSLTAIEASSGASVEALGVSGGDFSIEASSGAEVEVAGACDRLIVEASSGADVEAEDLSCQSGEIEASSGANVDVHISGVVDGDASSGGNISVEGGATRGNIETSSGGSVNIERGAL